MNMIICDFDETLVHTKTAVQEAYKFAYRVKNKDSDSIDWDEVWGKPGQEWATPDIKKVKDIIYSDCIKRYARKTWLGELIDWNEISILTGARNASVHLVIALLFGEDVKKKKCNLFCEASVQEKHATLKNIKSLLHDGREWDGSLYIDDNAEVAREVTKHTGFKPIIFTKDGLQDVNGEKKWTRSFLQQELTNVSGELWRNTISRCLS